MTDTNGDGGAMQVDTDLVRQLAELLNDSDLSEIEVQDGVRRIVVKRKLAGSYAAAPAPVPAPAPAPPAPGSRRAAHGCAGRDRRRQPSGRRQVADGRHRLSLGEPGAPPFVSPGDTVSAGDTLLIVEAMKVMNPITATRAGTVKQVLVIDAQPVEYDQPLVIIE
jgi:acetyl-CoA carboxylase biotin carboxyl carrier protein